MSCPVLGLASTKQDHRDEIAPGSFKIVPHLGSSMMKSHHHNEEEEAAVTITKVKSVGKKMYWPGLAGINSDSFS